MYCGVGGRVVGSCAKDASACTEVEEVEDIVDNVRLRSRPFTG